MRPNLVGMSTPGLDEHLRLSSASEPFQAQAFVAEIVVEALVCCILPRLAWIDERRINPHQHVDYVPRSNAARDLNGKALTSPLVDDAQTLQLLAVGAMNHPDFSGGSVF